MTFEISYDKQPEKFLAKLDFHIADRIIDKIEATLSGTPVPHAAKSVEGERGLFRLRVGKHRVLYRVDFVLYRIVIVKIEKRERAY